MRLCKYEGNERLREKQKMSKKGGGRERGNGCAESLNFLIFSLSIKAVHV
jgi:hypothetical protein